MTTLAKNKPREFEVVGNESFNHVPAVASDIIYEGAAVGESSGYGRPLTAGDAFMGFAFAKVDNSSGSAGDKDIKVRSRGVVILDVTGVTGVTDEGSNVYADDDNSFTLTNSSNTAIGKIVRYISGTKVAVAFEAASARSI